MKDFRKENDLDGSQGDLRSLGHPQRPRQAQPWGVQQVPFIFIKMNIWNMFHERFLKRKRSGWVPRWSEGSRTPSATSTSSTMGSTASTSYVHQKLTWHMFICCFSKTNRFKTVPAWYRVIKRLSDTLSDLNKLNQGEYSKYQLCSSKIDMTHVYMLFFKEVDQEALGHPQRPRQAHPWTSTQTVLILSQAGLSLLGHPHEPRQPQPQGPQQVIDI